MAIGEISDQMTRKCRMVRLNLAALINFWVASNSIYTAAASQWFAFKKCPSSPNKKKERKD